MPRSTWKGHYISFYSSSYSDFLIGWSLQNPNIITQRNFFVLKQFLNHDFLIYNGYDEIPLIINFNYLGDNVSSYILTREFDIEHAKKKKKKDQQQRLKKNIINKTKKQLIKKSTKLKKK